mgnify:CR=1 FL=1
MKGIAFVAPAKIQQKNSHEWQSLVKRSLTAALFFKSRRTKNARTRNPKTKGKRKKWTKKQLDALEELSDTQEEN